MLALQHTCDIARNVSSGTNNRRALTAVATGVRCLTMPMSAKATIQNGFDIGRAYDFYFDQATDVKVGDILTFNSNSYVVSGKEVFDFSLVGHIHVLASEQVS